MLPPDKEWLTVSDVALHLNLDRGTVRAMDIPFVRLTQKLAKIHIEDYKEWELKKRGITGASTYNAKVSAFRQPQKQEPRQKHSKRSLSSGTNSDELANLLHIQSRKVS